MEKGRISIGNEHMEKFCSSSSATTGSAPARRAARPQRTSAATTAPSQQDSAVAAIACRITCPVSAALSYGKGRNGRQEGRPPSSVVATFALPPSPLRRENSRHTHRQGEAVAQPWGPQFQAWCWSKCGELGPPIPSRGILFIQKLLCLAPHRTNRILGVEDGPHSRWTMATTTTPPCQCFPQTKKRRRCPPQSMDESGQGPRTAVAEAVASPLGVQPSIHSPGFSSSTGQSLGLMQPEKLCPPPSATAVSRRRTKTMPQSQSRCWRAA